MLACGNVAVEYVHWLANPSDIHRSADELSDLPVCLSRIVQKHGEQSLEACSPDEAGAMETDLNCLAQSGEAAKVVLPPVTASMLSALVEKAHASADTSMMQMYQRLTLEYGENG